MLEGGLDIPISYVLWHAFKNIAKPFQVKVTAPAESSAAVIGIAYPKNKSKLLFKQQPGNLFLVYISACSRGNLYLLFKDLGKDKNKTILKTKTWSKGNNSSNSKGSQAAAGLETYTQLCWI